MLQRVSVASILAWLMVATTSPVTAQKTSQLNSVMSSQTITTSAKSGHGVHVDDPSCGPLFGTDASEGAWHWVRDPIQERRRTVRIYNLHCVRCHGVNGRGVWDIPDVPDFSDKRWQLSRTDADIARLTLYGRGACMPAFRGTITLEEAWALARYIRTFSQPAAERPDTSRSVLPQNIAPRSASGVTYRRTPQQPVDVALRPNAPKRSNTSKNPLSWLIPFDKSQSSAEK